MRDRKQDDGGWAPDFWNHLIWDGLLGPKLIGPAVLALTVWLWHLVF